MPFDNFSYFEIWPAPHPGLLTGPPAGPPSSGLDGAEARGFLAFFTRYGAPVQRTIGFATSADGVNWSEWQVLAAMERGHYQISARSPVKAATAFNFHPQRGGLDARTNLYYLETSDNGRSWRHAAGDTLALPLTSPANPALVHPYQEEGLLVYLMDLDFDPAGHPVILYLTTPGFRPGPATGPRTWMTARWTGSAWDLRPITTSDHNYDTGSLYLRSPTHWTVLGPTEPGPQPHGAGGDPAEWETTDQGLTWRRLRLLTRGGPRNHSYARRPIPHHPGFLALWADGDPFQPSPSHLYFADSAGHVFLLPPVMTTPFARPQRVPPTDATTATSTP